MRNLVLASLLLMCGCSQPPTTVVPGGAGELPPYVTPPPSPTGDDGTTDDGTTGDGTADDGSTDDGSGDDGTVDDSGGDDGSGGGDDSGDCGCDIVRPKHKRRHRGVTTRAAR